MEKAEKSEKTKKSETTPVDKPSKKADKTSSKESKEKKPKAPATKSALKSRRQDKADQKESKNKKGVVFSENLEKDISLERRWNDHKTRGHSFIQGAFSMDEINKLKLALCEYAKDTDEPLKTLVLLCSRSKVEL